MIKEEDLHGAQKKPDIVFVVVVFKAENQGYFLTLSSVQVKFFKKKIWCLHYKIPL